MRSELVDGADKGVRESESRTGGWVGSPAIGWLKIFLEPSAYPLNNRLRSNFYTFVTSNVIQNNTRIVMQ
jgi:hypothetical protein